MNIETPEQISLVKQLRMIQVAILKSKDRTEIEKLGREAIKIATPVPPCISERLKDGKYKIDSKARRLHLLELDLELVRNDAWDMETVYFQIGTTIVMLQMCFVEGGISRLNEILELN